MKQKGEQMGREKPLYRCIAFSWEYGEQIIHKEKFVHAFSRKQALILAFMNDYLRDNWSIDAQEVTPKQ